MNDQTLYLSKGKLNGSQRNKVKNLLDMPYSPMELSEEIGINVDQIYRVYLPAGCPHSKDIQRHIVINGEEFKAWITENYKKRTLEKNQAYCVSCKKAVELVNPQRIIDGRNSYLMSTCPNCGNHVTRFIDCKRKKDSQ